MKKSLICGALCALALAVPAVAERVYVPVLGTTPADGKVLLAKVGVKGEVGQVGLIAVDADAVPDSRALLGGSGGVGAEVPAFTEDEVFQARMDVQIGDLPRPRDIGALTVGAANPTERTASCLATLSRPDGSRLAEIRFDVEPMTLARRDALAVAGNSRIGSVNVSCDQSFFPLAVATKTTGDRGPIIGKGVGPNGACQSYLNIARLPTGHYATLQNGIFHEATKSNPKGILCLRSLTDLSIAKAVFEWDVFVGPWSSRNRSGIHNLGYFFLNRYRSGVIGNVNVLGPNKDLLKIMQNINMPAGTNTNSKATYKAIPGATYHVVYTYDAASRKAIMQLQLNGQTVSNFSVNSQPGNNQSLVFRRFGSGVNDGLVAVFEFGNYLNQHAPEEATVGWKYSNFHLDMIPK